MLFRVALRSQPIDAAASREPVIDIGFALEPLDIPGFGTGIVGGDLPVVLGNPLHFEDNLGRFCSCHAPLYAPVWRKPLGRRQWGRWSNSPTTKPIRLAPLSFLLGRLRRLKCYLRAVGAAKVLVLGAIMPWS